MTRWTRLHMSELGRVSAAATRFAVNDAHASTNAAFPAAAAAACLGDESRLAACCRRCCRLPAALADEAGRLRPGSPAGAADFRLALQ